ncbi:hypothetical protein [Marinospirillum alkaliphilum]|uniref:Uncharacterized protein n=1 Tax=Marinospirillum alkaliphilum DSM 21637 TaxID=1122209 RepID=A0A1K1V0R4_9GAMM|nr:hypothetical protein [Marinospirillum alkaliphilum]SFX18395.1 hypothetical protein SAMN02745752_00701 [Marinospirillum alkaliphilum DSM 21637]
MLLKLGLVLLVAPLLILMGTWGVEYAAVSSCIHQGGSYDYLLGECLMDQRGIFVPFAERYPLLTSTSLWASCAGLVLCVVGLYQSRA